ncbi:fibronectin type III domain-containing protein [Patescibacteria group bacterium]|nr:fibronectin type III domain-containing protein [Patescibacteria group bacterium]MCL5091350.1 fibronectin type III domain-containing protein [Patescibacteria group bacterium]
MTIRKISLVLLVIWVGLVMTVRPVRAADLEISCDGKDCSEIPDRALFQRSTNWSPGDWEAKTITVRNNNDKQYLQVITKAASLEQDDTACRLDRHLLISITKISPGAVPETVWAGSVFDFFNAANPIILADFPPGGVADFRYLISFDQASGNECQGRSSAFALQLIFSGTAPPRPPVRHDNDPITVSAAPCQDTAPATAPTLLSALAGKGSVTLNWENAADPVTGYFLYYGSLPGQYSDTNPNAGGREATSYMVMGLSQGGRYYFSLRAVNGCALGPVSNELAVTVLGGDGNRATSPAPTGAQVLGAQTGAAATPTHSNPVLSLPKQSRRYLYWIIVVTQVVVVTLLWI